MSNTNTRVITAKTADYTVSQNTDEGALLTNRGASGAVTFTLPAAPPAGWWCDVAVVADQTVTVASGTADTLIVFNDATADSIAWATAGQKIGNGASFIFDGTGWITQQFPSTTGGAQTAATVTIVTA